MAARAVLAARDMTTERQGAAALDRTHHLHLVEADVARVGNTPRRTVIAQDVRDLQSWTRHYRRYFAGDCSLPRLVLFLRASFRSSSGLTTPEIMPVATRV